MGNKTGGASKSSSGATVEIGKALPQVKIMLNKLDNIYPDNNLHFLFLDDDFDPLYANSSWGDLEVGQRVVHSIFAKLRLTAKQFAQTLNESETRCIHMKGDSNIFSYYSIKDFHLVIHRTLPAPPPPSLASSSASLPSASSSSTGSKVPPSTSQMKVTSPSPSSSALGPPGSAGNVSSSSTISRDRSPVSKHHASQPSTSFVARHPLSATSSLSEPPSPRLGAKTARERSMTVGGSQASSSLYRDDEEKSKQVEALVYVIEGLIYGPTK